MVAWLLARLHVVECLLRAEEKSRALECVVDLLLPIVAEAREDSAAVGRRLGCLLAVLEGTREAAREPPTAQVATLVSRGEAVLRDPARLTSSSPL